MTHRATPDAPLDPCAAGVRCTDCSGTADGLRRNIDREPSCLACEAERQTMIQRILDAADEDEDPEPEQIDLFENGAKR